MGDAKRKAAAERAEWDALCKEAFANRDGMPAEGREVLMRINAEIATLGDKRQIPPRVLAVGVAALISGLAFVETEGDITDDQAIDDFIEYAHACLHVATAIIRIERGYRPGVMVPRRRARYDA